jgi:succinyl-diaminopimelate desuccinylase
MVMAIALTKLKRSGTAMAGEVLFASTAGEAVDCCGARRPVDRSLLKAVRAADVVEATREDVVLADKGALWVEVTTRGRPAQGSVPEEGVNAIDHMYRVLGRFWGDLSSTWLLALSWGCRR